MEKMNISITECPIEAVLAEDVMNDSGMIVLKAGTTLTEDKISSLEKHGLDNVVINSMSKLSEAELEAKKQQIEKNILKRMRKCEMSQTMVELKTTLINYYCRGL